MPRKIVLSTGIRKMLLSMMKRIGRGQAAEITMRIGEADVIADQQRRALAPECSRCRVVSSR